MSTAKPLISIILGSRNDGYGGGTKRLDWHISSLLYQCERHSLPLEMVLVDWNPPEENPPLYEALDLPERSSWFSLRVIDVPRRFHQGIPIGERLQFLCSRAWNVGFRRARGEFVMPRAADTLMSDELVQFVATHELHPEECYRVDRYDVPDDILEMDSIDKQLTFCNDSQNWICVNGRYPNDPAPTLDVSPPSPLHINACGDFMLMSRDVVIDRCGVMEEFDRVSTHCDSILYFAAHIGGVREHFLSPPKRIFHAHHENWWTKLDGNSMPFIDWKEARWDIVAGMESGSRPVRCNDHDSWGLPDEDLDDHLVVRADWEND